MNFVEALSKIVLVNVITFVVTIKIFCNLVSIVLRMVEMKMLIREKNCLNKRGRLHNFAETFRTTNANVYSLTL